MRNIILAALLVMSISLFGAYSDYSWEKSHIITGASGAGADYQVEIITHYGAGTDTLNNVYLNSKTQVDFDDVAFFDDDQTTQLHCWLQEKTDSDSAKFFVKVADDLGSNQTIYIVYGDADGTSQSNGDSTFIFFDDFDDASIDTGKWDNTHDSPTESGGYLSFDDGEDIVSQSLYSAQKALMVEAKVDEQDWIFGLGNSYQGYSDGVLITNSDETQNDNFDAFTLRTIASSTTTDSLVDGFTDWRTTTKTYTICWDADTCYYYQNNDLLGTISTNIPTATLGVAANVWYSSQSSQLDWDWVALRKFVSPEPAHSTWGSETAIGGAVITIDHIDGFELDVDIDYIQ